MFKTFVILNFGHWDLFGICDLRFGIYKITFWTGILIIFKEELFNAKIQSHHRSRIMLGMHDL
jgi:hypothetical protein